MNDIHFKMVGIRSLKELPAARSAGVSKYTPIVNQARSELKKNPGMAVEFAMDEKTAKTLYAHVRKSCKDLSVRLIGNRVFITERG